jgi:hypothetical protein
MGLSLSGIVNGAKKDLGTVGGDLGGLVTNIAHAVAGAAVGHAAGQAAQGAGVGAALQQAGAFQHAQMPSNLQPMPYAQRLPEVPAAGMSAPMVQNYNPQQAAGIPMGNVNPQGPTVNPQPQNYGGNGQNTELQPAAGYGALEWHPAVGFHMRVR